MNRSIAKLTDWKVAHDFEQEPILSFAQRGAVEAQIDQLKEQLLQPVLATIQNAATVRVLHRAANEAAALAWFSVCPILVLPLLLEEKLCATRQWWERQERLCPQPMPDHRAGATA